MTSNERALRAVRAQVQFELVQAGAEVAQAATLAAEAQQEVAALTQNCESATHELRDAMGRPRINPALIDAMHRLYQVEYHRLQHAQGRLTTAQQREEQARTALAGLRNRERSLERALQAERRKQQLKQQAIEVLRADDLWLQHTWRESP